MASQFFRTAFRKMPGSGSLVKMNPVRLGMWAFPAAVGGAWFIWPALDREWLIELGLAKEPDLMIKAVQAAKDARMAAKSKAAPAAEEEEEEEEEEAPAEEEEEAPEEEAAPAAEEEEEEEEAPAAEEASGDDDEDEEEEESSLPKFEPLLSVEGDSREAAWDKFTMKAIRPGEDDDDDDDEDDDDDDDDEE